MHEGMKSNASARKGRRLTVENDLERLRGGSYEESHGDDPVDRMIRGVDMFDI